MKLNLALLQALVRLLVWSACGFILSGLSGFLVVCVLVYVSLVSWHVSVTFEVGWLIYQVGWVVCWFVFVAYQIARRVYQVVLKWLAGTCISGCLGGLLSWVFFLFCFF